jgi:hydrogenase maturation protease
MSEKILILGIGNYLLGDEGIGVHTINELQKTELPENVDVIDGGTGGFHLLEYMREYKKIIMIDATLDNKTPGTVSVLKPRFSSDFPKSLSAHDIGLKDLLDTAGLLGDNPEIILITISISDFSDMLVGLSPSVQSSIPVVIQKIKEIINTIDIR